VARLRDRGALIHGPLAGAGARCRAAARQRDATSPAAADRLVNGFVALLARLGISIMGSR